MELIKKLSQYGILKSLDFAFCEIKKIIINRFIFRSYSQDMEDVIIDRLLKDKKNGFYLDIGANDPTRFNNTNKFYKKGWHGINIDPLESTIKKFNRKRKKDINLQCGIGNVRKVMTFYKMFPDTTSTFSKSEMNKFLKMGCKLVGKEKIQVYPLRHIVDKYIKSKKVDFMSLDVEGYDMDVLRSNNWSKLKPRIICVENSFNAESYLISKNYKKVYESKINPIYKLLNLSKNKKQKK